ncbi:MAG TPA: hypothetical protein VGL13_13455, partial [Polyangiaceae bacterium]
GATDRTVVDHFRAYRSAAEGASDYVGLLAQRFPKALDAARRGDAADFVRQLKQGGYFTGSEESYTHSVVSLANQARTLGFDALGTGPSAGTGDFPGASAPGIASASAANLIASGAAHLYASVDAPSVQTMARAGMLEMTDELSRAALRIAAAEPTHHDDE